MKLLTFTWSVSIEVPDTFDSENPRQYNDARNDAWQNTQRIDGELTNERDIPPNFAR